MPASAARKRAARRGHAPAEALPASIRLKHKPSGKERRVATGFAWDLFLLAGIFGLPLFWRRLPQWGAAVLALWLLVLISGMVRASPAVTELAQLVLFAAFLVLQLGLGFFGNRLMARTLLGHGWIIEQPGDLGTKRVIERWGLAARA